MSQLLLKEKTRSGNDVMVGLSGSCGDRSQSSFEEIFRLKQLLEQSPELLSFCFVKRNSYSTFLCKSFHKTNLYHLELEIELDNLNAHRLCKSIKESNVRSLEINLKVDGNYSFEPLVELVDYLDILNLIETMKLSHTFIRNLGYRLTRLQRPKEKPFVIFLTGSGVRARRKVESSFWKAILDNPNIRTATRKYTFTNGWEEHIDFFFKKFDVNQLKPKSLIEKYKQPLKKLSNVEPIYIQALEY